MCALFIYVYIGVYIGVYVGGMYVCMCVCISEYFHCVGVFYWVSEYALLNIVGVSSSLVIPVRVLVMYSRALLLCLESSCATCLPPCGIPGVSLGCALYWRAA